MLIWENMSLKKTNNAYGRGSFQVQGSRILNNIKDDAIYTQAFSKVSFLSKLNKSFLDSYVVSL